MERKPMPSVDIGCADDQCQSDQSHTRNCIVFHDCLESAAGTTMVEFYGFDLRCVERNSYFLLCLLKQILLFDEQELRLRVDESLDQPRTSETVNFDILPRNPLHIYLTVATNMCT